MRKIFVVLLSGLCALTLGMSPAYGAAATCYDDVIDGVSAPPMGMFAFNATSNPSSYIITEDNYDSASGSNSGYAVSYGTGYYLINWGNVDTPPYNTPDGTAFNAVFFSSATGNYGAYSGVVPSYFSECDSVGNVSLSGASGRPGAIPGGTLGLVTATGNAAGDVNLSWSAASSATGYLVYSSNQPCGSGSDPCGGTSSRGLYEFEKSVTSTATKIHKSNGLWWFVVVPTNAFGMGVHSDEASVTVLFVPTPTPTNTAVPSATPSPTATLVPTFTPTPTNTVPAVTPTPTPSPTLPAPTPTPVVPSTTFWGVSLMLAMMSVLVLRRREN